MRVKIKEINVSGSTDWDREYRWRGLAGNESQTCIPDFSISAAIKALAPLISR
jgi:hypothetical protein